VSLIDINPCACRPSLRFSLPSLCLLPQSLTANAGCKLPFDREGWHGQSSPHPAFAHSARSPQLQGPSHCMRGCAECGLRKLTEASPSSVFAGHAQALQDVHGGAAVRQLPGVRRPQARECPRRPLETAQHPHPSECLPRSYMGSESNTTNVVESWPTGGSLEQQFLVPGASCPSTARGGTGSRRRTLRSHIPLAPHNSRGPLTACGAALSADCVN
jgi:hypothetical protein